jgi:indolepyruvate ferredoxin oxidoreductase
MIFPILAKFRFLRGTFFDPFGHTEERRTERALIEQYCTTITSLCSSLDINNLPLAAEIARIPEEIRGYGHVKERHLRNAKEKEARLLAQLNAMPQQVNLHAA